MTDHPYFSILKFNLSIFPIHNMMDHPYFSIFKFNLSIFPIHNMTIF
jgi:hypothetical protein